MKWRYDVDICFEIGYLGFSLYSVKDFHNLRALISSDADGFILGVL